MYYLQSQANEGAGAPFVLVNDHCLIVKDRVVHYQGNSGKITGREIVDDGGSLVKDHIETYVVGLLGLVVQSHFIVVVNDEGWQYGEMQQPFAGEYEVVSITATDADVTDADLYVGRVGTS